MNLVTENAQSTAGVEVGSDDQNPLALFVRQASFRIVRFVPGRESLNRTYLDRCRLRKILHVLLRPAELP